METILRCFKRGENVKLVSEEIGYSRATIYAWKRLYDKKGAAAFMRYQDIPRGKLEEPSNSTSEEIAELKAQMRKMQLKIDVLEETTIDVLKNEYFLPELLEIIGIAKSSYYYLKNPQTDKYQNLRIKICEIFEENRSCYGYRRLNAILSRENILVSEKVTRRLMKEENIVARDFHADKPNAKWLSDLTEFAIPAGKVYLSPILDCFDGFGTSLNAALVNEMLLQSVEKLKPSEKPILHTDRGCHYRWQGWIDITENFGFKRSMSAKGCSPDNAACKGFSVGLKTNFSMDVIGQITRSRTLFRLLMTISVGIMNLELRSLWKL